MNRRVARKLARVNAGWCGRPFGAVPLGRRAAALRKLLRDVREGQGCVYPSAFWHVEALSGGRQTRGFRALRREASARARGFEQVTHGLPRVTDQDLNSLGGHR